MNGGLEGQRVVVVGLGKSGVGAVRLLVEQGAKVTVEESKTADELDAFEAAGVTMELGRPLSAERLVGMDLIVVSPGIPLSLPALVAARERGQHVVGEAELAWRFLHHDVPLVGITGTNGKSTTTALVGELFRQGGFRPFVGGNLGTALSDAARLPVPPGAYVVEYSSFQLEGFVDTRVTAAAILNLTPDHLDRYGSLEAYGAAKARILARQHADDVAVLNADDAQVMKLAGDARASRQGFTLDPTATPASRGLFTLARPATAGFQILRASGSEHFILANRALRGAHNLQNAMAAVLLALASGVAPKAIQAGLESFPGLPHRLEFVRSLGGVEWVNDSKATNVDSSVVALAAFPGQRVWLIAGGKGKGAPYAPLVTAARQKVAGVLTVGQDAGSIEREFTADSQGGFVVHPCQTLERAVSRARELAGAGDVVLLSPACASYDQFKNFEDRGDSFKRWVMAL